MTLEEILPALREGRAVGREAWGGRYQIKDKTFFEYVGKTSLFKIRTIALSVEDLNADDYEVLGE